MPKVDIPTTCRICGAKLTQLGPPAPNRVTCSEKCRKEFRRWSKLLPVTQRDLLDASMAYSELCMAYDDTFPPPELHLKAVKMVEMAAVAYVMTAAKVGKLPKPEPREKHPARCDCQECRPELYV